MPQVIKKTLISSGLKFIPFIGSITGAAFNGISNVKIAKSIGRATIDLCNEYMSDELLKGESECNFESIFISDNLARTFLLEYKKNES
jgi:uncharacterized protein (DUF697 family)